MKINIEIEVQVDDFSAPIFEDVSEALRKQLPYIHISWNDPCLGRVVGAKIIVNEIREGNCC